MQLNIAFYFKGFFLIFLPPSHRLHFLFIHRYFHPPEEIIAGAVFGLILFQVPLLLFSARLLQAHEDEDGDED